TLSTATGNNNWYINGDEITLTAPTGYGISTSNALTENTWNSLITLDMQDGNAKSATYYLQRESDGAISDVKTANYKVDKIAPIDVELSYGKSNFKKFLNTITFGVFFKENVTVTLTSSDTLSGVKEFKYTLNGTETTVTANDDKATFNIQPQYKGQISNVVAIDNAGNESTTVNTEYFAVDENAPTAPSVDLNGYTSDIWTNNNIKFTIFGATADSGIAKYQYSIDNGANWIDMSVTEKTDATATSPYNATKAEFTISADTNAVSYIFRAVSNSEVNGTATAATIVKIDKTTPTITATGDITTIKQSDKINVVPVAGISEIAKVEVQKDSEDYTDITETYAKGYTVTENGTYTFKVINGAGVTETTIITYVNIDTTKPVVVINSNGYTENSWKNNGDVTLTISNATENLGATKLEFKIGTGDWQEYTAPIVISEDIKATTYTFRAISKSGVPSEEKTFTVKRDTVAPEGDIQFNESSVKKFLNKITFGKFFNKTVNVKIIGTDALSEVATVEYCKSESILQQAEVEAINSWIKDTSLSINPSDKEKFIIYVKVTDKAGNVAYFGSDGTTFDTTAPVISGIKNDETYYTTQKVTVKDHNIDTITVNDAAFISGSTIAGNVDKTYTLVATDKAGNETTVTVTMKPIASLSAKIDHLIEDYLTISNKETIENVKSATLAIDIANATDVEKSALKAIADKCDALLKKIDDVQTEFNRINTEIGKYDINSVKSTDKAAIEKLIEDINKLPVDNMTDAEKIEINKSKNTANNLIGKISTVAAEITRITDAINSYETETIKLKDKADLEKLIADISKLPDQNLTDDQKAQLADGTDTCNAFLEEIQNAQNVIDLIKALPEVSKIQESNKDAIFAAKEAYHKLTDNEKGLVGTELAEKLTTLGTAVANLSLVDNPTGTRVEAIGDTEFDPNTVLVVKLLASTEANQLSVAGIARGNELVSLFDISLMLGNKKIQPNGKVKVTLTLTDEQIKKYQDFKIVFIDENGKSTIVESVVNGNKIIFETDHFSCYGIIGTKISDKTTPTKDKSPLTGETNNMQMWIALMFVLGGIVTTFGITKKHKKSSVK
ncbi:MAG: hypothetical protein GX896_03860, partial [Clostridiales bacterium]|nr:hypothetical protein [Clostridiales bacterium]